MRLACFSISMGVAIVASVAAQMFDINSSVLVTLPCTICYTLGMIEGGAVTRKAFDDARKD